MNNRRILPALIALAGLSLLSACEGELTVDIQGDAPSSDGELTLKVDRIEFLHSDGNTQSFDLDETLSFDSNGLSSTNLLSGESLREGVYTEVRLRVIADDSSYDDDGDSGTDPLEISGSTITAVADNRTFRMRADDTESLTLHLASYASLPLADADSTVQDFEPVMQLIRTDFAYALSVTLNAESALATYCADQVSRLPRLYLFDTDDSSANDDLDGGSDDAQRVVMVTTANSSIADRIWTLPRVAKGEYRIALSCDDDDPASDEDITFFCAADITVDSAGTVVLDDVTDDNSCTD